MQYYVGLEETSVCIVVSTREWPACVIFATLYNSFRAASLRDKFSVPMLRIYYNSGGCHHEISGRQAICRGR
jgi:hypothetical protein